MMKIGEFKDMTDLYSADLSRWPQVRLHEALALMEQDRAARAYFDETLAMENALRRYAPDLRNLQGLEDRIMKNLSGAQGGKGRPMPSLVPPGRGLLALFAPGGGLLTIALLGFFVGFHPAPAQDEVLAEALYSETQLSIAAPLEEEEEVF